MRDINLVVAVDRIVPAVPCWRLLLLDLLKGLHLLVEGGFVFTPFIVEFRHHAHLDILLVLEALVRPSVLCLLTSASAPRVATSRTLRRRLPVKGLLLGAPTDEAP